MRPRFSNRKSCPDGPVSSRSRRAVCCSWLGLRIESSALGRCARSHSRCSHASMYLACQRVGTGGTAGQHGGWERRLESRSALVPGAGACMHCGRAPLCSIASSLPSAGRRRSKAATRRPDGGAPPTEWLWLRDPPGAALPCAPGPKRRARPRVEGVRG
jgi:hypothetical protein